MARIARLAELEVAAGDVDRLTAQLDGIVAYVGQLATLGDPGGVATTVPARATVLREDRVDPIPLSRPLADLAPEFRDGFFLVPRLPGMDGR